MASTIVCRNWQRNSSGTKLPSSSRAAVSLPSWPPKRQRAAHPLSSVSAATPSSPGWVQVSTGPAAICRRGDRMKRRAFILALGGAAASALLWPLAARAQQRGPMPMVGYFSSQSREYDGPRLEALRRSLSEAGYVDGANVAVEYRWADGDYDRLAAQAAEFARQPVAVIFAGSLPAALAAKAATTTSPIVVGMGADPVKLGVVASLNQPGGNVTGVTQLRGARRQAIGAHPRARPSGIDHRRSHQSQKSELRGPSRRRARGGQCHGAADPRLSG